MHERLRAKVWSRWNLLLAVNFPTWWCNWSTAIHTSSILSESLILRASSMAIYSAGIQMITEGSSVSVINHAVSMSFAAQAILIVPAMSTHHIVWLLSLLYKIIILGRVESSGVCNAAGRMSYLGLLISRWDLVVLILNHAFHVFGYDVVFADHGLLLLGWLLACHCSTFTSERVLLSALRMLVWIREISVKSVLMRAASHA